MTKPFRLQVDWSMRTRTYRLLVGSKTTRDMDRCVYDRVERPTSERIRNLAREPVELRALEQLK